MLAVTYYMGIDFVHNYRKDIFMNTEEKGTVYVKVKDMAGNDFICPLNELIDPKSVSDADLENCFEGDVVGRYAGIIKIVDSGD